MAATRRRARAGHGAPGSPSTSSRWGSRAPPPPARARSRGPRAPRAPPGAGRARGARAARGRRRDAGAHARRGGTRPRRYGGRSGRASGGPADWRSPPRPSRAPRPPPAGRASRGALPPRRRPPGERPPPGRGRWRTGCSLRAGAAGSGPRAWASRSPHTRARGLSATLPGKVMHRRREHRALTPRTSCIDAGQRVPPGATLTLGPPTYGQSVVRNGGTLILTPAGTFTFCSLQTTRGVTIVVSGATASTINVVGSFRLANVSSMLPVNTTPTPSLNVGGGRLRIGAGATIQAFISAPNARGAFGRKSTIAGRFCVDSNQADKGITMMCPTTTTTTTTQPLG